MPFVSYAQNGEDVLLWRALRDVEAGFYIDVGAAHPTHDSVTMAFYERGWHGINIDPDPDSIAALRAARPRDINLELAIAAQPGQANFYSFPGTGWSTLSAEVAGLHQAQGHNPSEHQVKTQTLAAIYESQVSGEVHFLKIDVEGAEAQVIASCDFTRFRPWIIVVEATVPNSAEQVPRDWEPDLIAAGYRFAHLDGLNCFYVSSEHADRLLPVLATEANIFDNYIAVRQIEEAQAAADRGLQLPGLASSVALQEAERRAEESERRAAQAAAEQAEAIKALEQRIIEADAKARDVELRMLDQEIEVQFLRAEVAQPLPPIACRANQPNDNARATQPGAQKLFFDASLMLHHGFISAVGIVRVEHYVAEYLAQDPAIALEFVIFDRDHRSYRAATAQETSLLEQILFHRYEPSTLDRPADAQRDDQAANSGVCVSDHQVGIEATGTGPESEVLGIRPKFGPFMFHRLRRKLSPRRWPWLKNRIGRATSLPHAEFNRHLDAYALRRFPIRGEQSGPRRAGIRLMRRVFLAAARVGYRAVLAVMPFQRRLEYAARRLVAPDSDAKLQPGLFVAASSIVHDYDPFRAGDVLVSMANTWDYMDYGYLSNLGRNIGVRLICVIYDVVGMELPFVTPAPAHLYHRHWVEIGHTSERLVAISRFSAESYYQFIAGPNGIDVPIDHALLPNFLQERAAEIGETVVDDLNGRDFVVYCSTIEVRKNHILLLHLWEELRQRISPEKLPTLIFVGKWGWSAEATRLLTERNWRLRPHLRVMTETSDAELIWLYRHARFTVFPSLSEGFGLAAAESLSFGTPVVISHCPALLEATEQLMPAFHPHDFIGWRQELERLILDDDHLDALREKAARFRGPDYTTFAAKIRDAALTPPVTGRSMGNPLLVKENRL